MIDTQAAGVSELASDELGQLSGGETPGWWWVFLYLTSESKDFVEGFKDGFSGG